MGIHDKLTFLFWDLVQQQQIKREERAPMFLYYSKEQSEEYNSLLNDLLDQFLK